MLRHSAIAAIAWSAGAFATLAADLPMQTRIGEIFAAPAEPKRAYRTVEPLPIENTWVATSPRVPGYYGQAGDFDYRSYYDTPSLKIFSRLPYACPYFGYGRAC